MPNNLLCGQILPCGSFTRVGNDGLYEPGECGCDLEDIIPCGSVDCLNCIPGFKRECEDGFEIGPAIKVGTYDAMGKCIQVRDYEEWVGENEIYDSEM